MKEYCGAKINEKPKQIKVSDAFSEKAVQFHLPKGGTVPYRIAWWLWSADVWYGKVPLMKTLVLANVLVWLIFT